MRFSISRLFVVMALIALCCVVGKNLLREGENSAFVSGRAKAEVARSGFYTGLSFLSWPFGFRHPECQSVEEIVEQEVHIVCVLPNATAVKQTAPVLDDKATKALFEVFQESVRSMGLEKELAAECRGDSCPNPSAIEVAWEPTRWTNARALGLGPVWSLGDLAKKQKDDARDTLNTFFVIGALAGSGLAGSGWYFIGLAVIVGFRVTRFASPELSDADEKS